MEVTQCSTCPFIHMPLKGPCKCTISNIVDESGQEVSTLSDVIPEWCKLRGHSITIHLILTHEEDQQTDNESLATPEK